MTSSYDDELMELMKKSICSLKISNNNTKLTNSQLAEKVHKAALKASKLTVYPYINEIVIAPFKGRYYRAIVIKSDKLGGNIKVGFIDNGTATDVVLDDIKKLDDKDLMEYPPQMISLVNATESAVMEADLDELCVTYTIKWQYTANNSCEYRQVTEKIMNFVDWLPSERVTKRRFEAVPQLFNQKCVIFFAGRQSPNDRRSD